MAQGEKSLSGKTVIVTGGGRGLGRAMTEALAGAGASVFAIDIDQAPLDELKREVDGDIVGHCVDVSNESQVHDAIARCIKTFGHLDMVVNNAGIGMSSIPDGFHKPFYEIDSSSLSRFFEVHVLGTFLFSKAAAPHFVAQGFGSIVTVTTSLWFMLEGTNTPYGPMKAANEALSSAMAHDLAGTGVAVNVLVPGGAADTRFIPEIPNQSREHLIKPAVMGPPIIFLASSEADGITGRRIVAKDWDLSLSASEAFERSSAPIGWSGDH
jgi:NAD(P)-dependent dehydrogenase (short-subunit alcohol dehydrogenase family)